MKNRSSKMYCILFFVLSILQFANVTIQAFCCTLEFNALILLFLLVFLFLFYKKRCKKYASLRFAGETDEEEDEEEGYETDVTGDEEKDENEEKEYREGDEEEDKDEETEEEQ